MSGGLAPAAIDALLARRRVIITCGTGGVGKTTLSAALGARAALLGRRVVVVTIDPAKRLRTSLGHDSLGDSPTELTEELRAVAARDGRAVPGRLWAVIPDTRKTFEAFARDVAASPALADQVISSPLFETFARDFSGANEYMALQRLQMLARDPAYDLVILDTPPSRNTLHFLRGPRLLARLFEERLIRWVVAPTNRLLAGGMRKTLELLSKLVGEGFMTQLIEFAAALLESQAGFDRNLHEMTGLLESDATGFVMVTAPSPELVREARAFIESARGQKLQFDGVLVNRTLAHLTDAPGDDAHPGVPVLRALLSRERRVLGELAQARAEVIGTLPELSRDVHGMEDLVRVAEKF